MAPKDATKGARKPAFPSRGAVKGIGMFLSAVKLSFYGTLAYGAYQFYDRHASFFTVPNLEARFDAFKVATFSAPLWAGLLAVAAVAWALYPRRRDVLMLDFECWRGPEELQVSYALFKEGSRRAGVFDDESIEFQEKIVDRSGLSQETYFSPGLHEDPPNTSLERARQEAEIVMFDTVRDLLAKTGVSPKQIDVLVTNCSLFCPTPSLAAMVINHFGFRSDVDAYNLGGMGCSAGVLAIGLGAKLLRERRQGSYALIVSTENITQNWYCGRSRSMIIPNTIFRMGGSATLLSTHAKDRSRAKYRLANFVRVHLGADDVAYRCVFQRPDSAGHIGVELNKDLVSVAARAMIVNLSRLGRQVLPLSEKLATVVGLARRKLPGGKKYGPYVPDFTKAFDHFCLHAGGRAVIEGISKQLGLSKRQTAPSANALHWYGNTSSSTVFYSLGYIESVQGVKKGEKVWQIGFGSGFKCNSAVWEALRNIKVQHHAWHHIVGREDEALDLFAEIAEMRNKERIERAEQEAAQQAEAAEAAAEAERLAKKAEAAAFLDGAPKQAPTTRGLARKQQQQQQQQAPQA